MVQHSASYELPACLPRVQALSMTHDGCTLSNVLGPRLGAYRLRIAFKVTP